MSRKFRWTFEADFPVGKVPVQYVKVTSRPTLSNPDEKPEEHKHPPLMTTFFDTDAEAMAGLYKVLGAYYDKVKDHEKPVFPEELMGTATLLLLVPKIVITPPAPSDQKVEAKPGKMGLGTLGSLGIGGWTHTGEWEVLEQWTLKKIWPKTITFGELDHSSSECCTIEVTWVYDEAVYKNVKEK